jgi:hypothetical protein
MEGRMVRRNTLRADAPEVSELGANPNVVIAAHHNPVRGVDAGDEDRRRASATVVVYRNLDNMMKRGVGNEEVFSVVAELDAVYPERRGETGSGAEQRVALRGFLFPASLAFSKDGETLYVSNLTLFLPFAGAQAAIDSAWTLQVNGYTVSQLPAKIPPFPDNDDAQ